MYVVIDFKWHQYIVKEGDKIVVDKIDAEENSDINIDKVLLSFDEEGKDVKLWTPYLKANVVAKVVEHTKGEKIHVFKFKNKNRYSRKIWFRPKYTVLQIQKIEL